MMRFKLTLFVIIFFTFNSLSQENTSNVISQGNKGFFNITKFSYIKAYSLKTERFVPGEGIFFGEPDASSSAAWSLQTINGWFLSPHFSLGLGIGLDGYRNPNLNTLPIFLDARYYVSAYKTSLFAFMDIGPTVRFGGENSELERGIMFNFGGGYKLPISDKIELITELYFAHKTISLLNEPIRTSDDIIKINGVGLSFGILF